MIQKVARYQSNDGELHESMEAAELHESAEIVSRWLYDNRTEGTDVETYIALAKKLVIEFNIKIKQGEST